MAEPLFDPTKPFETVVPQFDPTRGFEVVEPGASLLEPEPIRRVVPKVDPEVAKLYPAVRAVMSALGEGFSQDYQEKLGLSEESKQLLAKHGVLPKDENEYDHPLNPFTSFRDRLIAPLVSGLAQWDAMRRFPLAVYHGAQEAIVEAGSQIGPRAEQFARDIVSMPDAFIGSPGSFATPRLGSPRPFRRDGD